MSFLNNLQPEGAALLGAIIGASGTTVTIWIQKYYENKKSFRESFLNVGIRNWEGAKDVALAQRDTFKGNLAPMDLFVIHHAKLLKLIEADDVNVESLEELQKDMRELGKTTNKHTEILKKK